MIHNSTVRSKSFILNKIFPASGPGIVAVLDVGSSKVSCLIATMTPACETSILHNRAYNVKILGHGIRRAHGIKSGTITDLKAAEQSVRLAVDAAERMAGVTVESIIVNLTTGNLSSKILRTSIRIGGRHITPSDIKQVLETAGNRCLVQGRILLHSIPIGYSIDGSGGIKNPSGMLADELSVDIHAVTANLAPLRNLELIINQSYLEVEAVVATPYASGLSTIVDDEGALGVSCVDMGGETTSLAIFSGEQFVHASAFAVGGKHVTMDLAHGLSTKLEHAERIKLLHGSAMIMSNIDNDMVEVPCISDTHCGVVSFPKRTISKIIRPRVEEILEFVRDSLSDSGFDDPLRHKVVLTGGASQLTGLVDVANYVLGREVRLGRPLGIHNLPHQAKGAAFAASAGLLLFPQAKQEFEIVGKYSTNFKRSNRGYFSNFGQWLKENW